MGSFQFDEGLAFLRCMIDEHGRITDHAANATKEQRAKAAEKLADRAAKL